MALARAILRATSILVLDEATSQMDSDTERRVQASLRESFSHSTVITITHRIDTILDYDSPDGLVGSSNGRRDGRDLPCPPGSADKSGPTPADCGSNATSSSLALSSESEWPGLVHLDEESRLR
ncbi:hypothetical protein HPB52_024272 [Rhipicephalus sanguineus]|uniref:ABC transporter domain-containing protein n=1 Tax=Rhipicephalus sanguineus TaxID=34632 RepID=A0A9D4TCH1_RHISA|nr:hypothetical protein HPB52_024272 [Rhipicephalus sanguineus]